MAPKLVSITQDGTAHLPWSLTAAPTTADIEYVAGALRQLLDQNPPGAIQRAEVAFSMEPENESGLELGCWLQSILPKLSPLQEVVLEFIAAPKDLNAMIRTPLAAMPRIRIRVTPGGVETLE